MKTKFLMLMLLASYCFLCSCSKDDYPGDNVLKNISGSKWMATYNGGYYELSFDNGTYELDYDAGGTNSVIYGSYSQNSRNITMNKKPFITHSIMYLGNGELSEYGTSLTIPVYYDIEIAKDELAYTLKFILMLEEQLCLEYQYLLLCL